MCLGARYTRHSWVFGRLSEEKLAATGPARSADELGLTVQTLTPHLAEAFGVKTGEGVVVTEVQPGSVAAVAGIGVGTVILKVDRTAVDNAVEFAGAVKQAGKDKRVLLLNRKDNMQRFLALSR